MKKSLDTWWGITDRKSLFDSLEFLETGGHRKSFEKKGMYIQSLSEVQYKSLIDSFAEDEEGRYELEVVREYYEKLGEKSLFGWDYSRYICLCRWGYMLGYINEDEAWEKIMPAAVLLQEKFDSWEDLGRNYLIGRKFWSYKYTKEEGDIYEDAFQRLLDMRSSPWNKYRWDMKLGSKKAVADDSQKN